MLPSMRARWFVLALLAAAGCAGSREISCPPGTTERGGAPPKYAATWCEKRGGVRHGPIVGYTRSGRVLYEGHLADGVWHGIVRGFGADGEPLGAVAIHRGTGSWKMWHENGRLAEEGAYKAGKKVGAWAAFHDNGAKAVEGTYADGLESGVFRWWSPRGELVAEIEYDKGRYHGTARTFDEEGRLLVETRYVDGVRQAALER